MSANAGGTGKLRLPMAPDFMLLVCDAIGGVVLCVHLAASLVVADVHEGELDKTNFGTTVSGEIHGRGYNNLAPRAGIRLCPEKAGPEFHAASEDNFPITQEGRNSRQ